MKRTGPRSPARTSRKSSRSLVSFTALLVILFSALALLILGIRELADAGGDGDEPIAAAPITLTGSAGDGQASTDSVGSGVPSTPAITGDPAPPFVRATLTGKDLVLTGSVPSAELAEGLVQSAELAYAPFVRSELVVDEQLPTPEWLSAAPRSVMLLQTITEGSMVVAAGQVTVTGVAASADDAATLSRYLIEETGLPVDVQGIQVNNLRPAVYVIAATDGRLALSGALPNDEIAAGLEAAATAVYGAANVFDASTVDETVAPTLWMYNPDALIATLSAFPDFEVRLDGGAFSASLSGGSVFSSDSAEHSPNFTQVLNFGIVVLSRDPSMSITIEGHTDSEGPDDYNLELSQTRADAVAAYFAGAGIGADRITAIGVGEKSPVASNDTPEGRARNRRVEFSLQSDS